MELENPGSALGTMDDARGGLQRGHDVPRVPDPLTNRYRFKLGKGRVTKLGESPYKRSLTSMSFVLRNVV